MKPGYIYLYLRPMSEFSTELFDPGDIIECMEVNSIYGYHVCCKSIGNCSTVAAVHYSQVFEIGKI